MLWKRFVQRFQRARCVKKRRTYVQSKTKRPCIFIHTLHTTRKQKKKKKNDNNNNSSSKNRNDDSLTRKRFYNATKDNSKMEEIKKSGGGEDGILIPCFDVTTRGE